MSLAFLCGERLPAVPLCQQFLDRPGVGRALADPVVLAVVSNPDDPKFDLEAYLTLNEVK